MIGRAMPHGDILGYAPPLTLSRAEADRIVAVTKDALAGGRKGALITWRWVCRRDPPPLPNEAEPASLPRRRGQSREGTGAMTTSIIREAIRSRKMLRGVHMTYPAPRIIRALGGLGLDFVYLDGEHGAFTTAELEQHCIVAEGYGITPIARVPDGSRATITRFLDRGVRGIIVPHVESALQARRAVEAAYFAPQGDRSYGGAFPANTRDKAGLPQFLADCNDAVTLSVMIELRAGLDAIDEIAAVDGVDYLNFGMMDFAQALGHPGRPDHPEVLAAVERGSARIRAAGKPVREDFMRFAWVDDMLFEGAKAKLGLAGSGPTSR